MQEPQEVNSNTGLSFQRKKQVYPLHQVNYNRPRAWCKIKLCECECGVVAFGGSLRRVYALYVSRLNIMGPQMRVQL